jgi:hypothetical protein
MVGAERRTLLSHGLCSSRQGNCASAKTTTTAAEAFFGCCLFLCVYLLKAGAEPTLSWQPLTHV